MTTVFTGKKPFPAKVGSTFSPQALLGPILGAKLENSRCDVRFHQLEGPLKTAPLKINMEPINHPTEKEHIFLTYILGLHVNFPGCIRIRKHQPNSAIKSLRDQRQEKKTQKGFFCSDFMQNLSNLRNQAPSCQYIR